MLLFSGAVAHPEPLRASKIFLKSQRPLLFERDDSTGAAITRDDYTMRLILSTTAVHDGLRRAVYNEAMIYLWLALVVMIALWSVWGFFGSRVEQADYTLVKKINGYEIRDYPAHIAAQTSIRGSYGESMSKGFGIVAGYIFGGNTKNQSIAMTAPVVSQKGGKTSERIAMTAPVTATAEGDSQVISFGMPRSYTLETLPTPNDARVTIVMIPAKRYAVMKFSGYRSEARVKQMQEKLLSALARDGVAKQGSTAYAGYNAPWTPPWMTRHEVRAEIFRP